jgi:hypothetical protein
MSTTEENVEKDGRTKLIIIVVAVVSVLLVGALIYVAKSPSGRGSGPPALEGALRSGSPEFDKYKELIKLDAPEAVEGTRAIGDIVMELTTTVRNFTGKTITGLEIRGSVVDSQGSPVKERTIIVIPNVFAGTTELDNNKTMPVKINIEGMTKEADRANIKMEVTAIRVK